MRERKGRIFPYLRNEVIEKIRTLEILKQAGQSQIIEMAVNEYFEKFFSKQHRKERCLIENITIGGQNENF